VKVNLNAMGIDNIVNRDVAKVLDIAVAADEAGLDVISISDHLGFSGGAHAERVRSYGFPYPLEQQWFEPIAFLSAVAARTRRVRLSSSILVATLRPALLLAKQLATLDAISGGRVTIALGVGWQQAEFEASGLPFDHRLSRLEEIVRACRALWAGGGATFHGDYVRFDDFHAYPLPPQREHLPVLLGIPRGPRNFARIARVADGWAVPPTARDSLREDVAALRAAFVEEGRDPDGLEIEVQMMPLRDGTGRIDWGATQDQAEAYADLGATTLGLVTWPACQTLADLDDALAFLADFKATNRR